MHQNIHRMWWRETAEYLDVLIEATQRWERGLADSLPNIPLPAIINGDLVEPKRRFYGLRVMLSGVYSPWRQLTTGAQGPRVQIARDFLMRSAYATAEILQTDGNSAEITAVANAGGLCTRIADPLRETPAVGWAGAMAGDDGILSPMILAGWCPHEERPMHSLAEFEGTPTGGWDASVPGVPQTAGDQGQKKLGTEGMDLAGIAGCGAACGSCIVCLRSLKA